MKIVRIFGQNLFAVHYENESKDEFRRLFSIWEDPFELYKFFSENEKDLQSDYWHHISVDAAVQRTLYEANEFKKKIKMLAEEPQAEQMNGLESVFAPLNDMQYQIWELDKRKAKRKWLRIYGLRAEKDVYIVTGGAIKLSEKMKEREHTKKELQKIDMCRQFLLAQGLTDINEIMAELGI